MHTQIVLVNDPLGKVIYFPLGICIQGEDIDAEDIYDDFKRVIESPACIIEMHDSRKFYFRALGWNLNILLEVVLQEDKWVAINCIKNPDTDYISTLLKKGKFIPGSSLD
jgi:ATP-dependent RNA circularization protein (DNA/RNA ligase family)